MNKFLPPKPEFSELHENGINFPPTRTLDGIDFDIWYDTHIVPLFENAVEVYAEIKKHHELYGPWIAEGYTTHTHKAILINIKPIKQKPREEEAEELLKAVMRDIDEYDSGWIKVTEATEKARKWLEKK